MHETGCCNGKLYQYMTPSNFEHDPSSSVGTWRSIWSAFEEQTTAHGIPNFSRARGTFKQCFWIVMMLGMLAGLVYNVRGLVVTYLRYDVSVSISITQEQQFVFPAVTICNLSPVKRSALASSRANRRQKRALASDTESSTDTPVAYCSNGWRLYNDSCYYFSSDEVDQHTADVRCQTMSAQLTSINDQNELDFISSVISGNGIDEYWIGLCKKIGWLAATYWLDGSTSTFRTWGAGEPNQNTTCIRIDTMYLKDKDCSAPFNYICKMRQDAVNTVTTKRVRQFPWRRTTTTTVSPSTAQTTTSAYTTTTATTTTEATTEPEAVATTTTTAKATTTTATPTTRRTTKMTSTAVSTTPIATSTIKSTTVESSTPAPKTTSTKLTITPKVTPLTTKTTQSVATSTAAAPKVTSTTLTTTTRFTSPTAQDTTSTAMSTTAEATSKMLATTQKVTSLTAKDTKPTSAETSHPSTKTTSGPTSTTPRFTSPRETTETIQGTSTTGSEFSQRVSTTQNSVTSKASTVISPTISRHATTTNTEGTSRTTSLESVTASFKTTDFAETATSAPDSSSTVISSSISPKAEEHNREVSCCCKCCQWDEETSAESCAICTDDSLETAGSCASNPGPTPSKVAPNFEAPPTLSGSRFPDRPAYRKDFLTQEMLTEHLASMPDEAKSVLGFSISDLIIDCLFEGVPCNITRDFTTFYNNLYGNCYVFNSGWANYTAQTRMSAHSGPKHGLVLTANIQQDEYVDEVGDIAGIRVVVLPQNQIAFPEDDGVTVSPGHLTSVGIQQTIVERQPSPYGNCTGSIDDRQRSVYAERYQVEYDSSSCLKTCYQRNVIERCRCADPHVPSSGKTFGNATVPVCSTSNITQDDCKYEVSSLYANNKLVCDCPDRCSDKLFKMKASVSAWPAKATKDTIRRSLEVKIGSTLSVRYFDENIVKLEVFYESFIATDISETPQYQLINLISDIGGVVGLWFGFAFMTFIEILEFLTDFSVLLIEKIRKSVKNQEANKNIIR